MPLSNYQKILIAVDLEEKSDDQILAKANYFAEKYGAELYLIHAVEHLNAYGTAVAYPAIADVEGQISEEHKATLEKFAQKHNIATDRSFLEMGAPAQVIVDKAKALDIDLIIVGSHGRHGLALLLGSTTDSVLHKTKCDLLAIRLSN